MSDHSFFSELKRRNVYKVAVAYAVVGWLLVQVATQVFPFFEIPNWAVRLIVLAIVIGFPIALVMAWAFELTPEGLKRTEDVDRATEKRGKSHAWIYVVAVGAVLSIGLFFLGRYSTGSNAASRQSEAGAGSSIPKKSIAVLPFENLSEDKANAYFASGMQDEILTRLAGIHDLKVISRTSTEQYASHPPNLKIVAEQLGVATVLEGSVQKANGKVRINLQLIDARSDSHLWAKNYDRDLKDVFAVQSDVAEKVADALKAQLLPAESARIASVPTQNPEAYDRFLRAEYFVNRFNSGAGKDWAMAGPKAEDLYESAIAADPDFALASARLSFLKAAFYWYGIDPSPQAIATAQTAAARALALQPDLPEAHLAMGYVHYWGHRDYAAALAEFAIARANLPNDAQVLAAIAAVHRRQGQLSLAIREFERAVALDPRNAISSYDFSVTLLMLRRYTDAEAACDRALALAPDNVYASLNKAVALQMGGDLEASGRVLAAISADDDPQGSITVQRFHLAMAMRQPDAALGAIAKAPAGLTDGMDGVFIPVAMLRGQALTLKGDTAAAHGAFLEAQQALESRVREMPEQMGTHGEYESDLSMIYAGLGQKDAALKAGRRATELLPMSQDAFRGQSYLARLTKVEAQVGETDAALDHINQLLAGPAGYAVSAASLRFDPVWDPLRTDPRFQKLITQDEVKAVEKKR
jgi:TolB-like protein/Flp pilus assembly protein TadD